MSASVAPSYFGQGGSVVLANPPPGTPEVANDDQYLLR